MKATVYKRGEERYVILDENHELVFSCRAGFLPRYRLSEMHARELFDKWCDRSDRPLYLIIMALSMGELEEDPRSMLTKDETDPDNLSMDFFWGPRYDPYAEERGSA